MKKRNKYLVIFAGAFIIIGIIVYASMSLSTKLNQVAELNGQLDEQGGKTEEVTLPSLSPSPSSSPMASPDEQPTVTPITEPVHTPEVVPTTKPNDVSMPSPAATLTPGPTSDNVDKGQKPKDESTNSEEKSRKKKEIDASVTAKLGKLKSSCQATSSSLVKQIAGELSADKDASLADIQKKYLNKVFSAESDCDAKFNELMSSAKSEYKAADLGEQGFPSWSKQYEDAKAQARADALTAIAQSLK